VIAQFTFGTRQLSEMQQLPLMALEERFDNIKIRHILRSPWDALDRVNWDFTGETTQYLTHTFHSYPARFIPQIPNLFIQLFTEENATILDPFAGCGTTLVEAMLLKRHAIGVDMNPLACLISKAKTTIIPPSDLMRLQGYVDEMQKYFPVRESTDIEYLTRAGTFDDTDMRFPDRKISALFTPEIMTELKQIRKYLDQMKDNDALFNLGLVALSATIRVVIETEKANGLYRTFRQKIRAMSFALEETSQRVRQSHVTILQGDARWLKIPDHSVSLVVTSPPYVNALDYYRVHQYNMAWLGMDYVAFRQQEIGGHSHFMTNRFRLLSEYLGDMLRAMLEMNRTLKPSGVCVIVVGNSSVEYELIETHKFFAAMAKDAGFVIKKTLFRNVDVTRKYHSREIGKINSEHILILEKVGIADAKANDDAFVASIVRREMLRFKKQVDKMPGSSLRGKHVPISRLRQNPKRLEAAIATIEKDTRIKPNGKIAE
jgi:site-specific DNA-methyltransferase (cytosine-N4-specific)